MLFFGYCASSRLWGLDVITPFPFVCLAVSHPPWRLLCQATLTSPVWFQSPISVSSEALTSTLAYRSVPAHCRRSVYIYRMNESKIKRCQKDENVLGEFAAGWTGTPERLLSAKWARLPWNTPDFVLLSICSTSLSLLELGFKYGLHSKPCILRHISFIIYK